MRQTALAQAARNVLDKTDLRMPVASQNANKIMLAGMRHDAFKRIANSEANASTTPSGRARSAIEY
jgi:hypothetical protein